jgi:hypothetical protein
LPTNRESGQVDFDSFNVDARNGIPFDFGFLSPSGYFLHANNAKDPTADPQVFKRSTQKGFRNGMTSSNLNREAYCVVCEDWKFGPATWVFWNEQCTKPAAPQTKPQPPAMGTIFGPYYYPDRDPI